MLLESLIVSSCVGFTGDMLTACNKALTAASKQTGIEAFANNKEEKYTKKAENEAVYYLGHRTVEYIGAAVFVARSVASQSVSFGLPTLGLCDKIDANLGANQSMLNFKWDFK